ncbi:unnamed protein product [Mytilus coruscus]|uniref:Mutator-like transposase domain-containing protein n=1 Tax=Mytilus coruscus TaxID=42192 RepID=A0A6J8BLM3_MYTCO|nr:unnamed protein product [Mytilus coruscus]
MKIDNVDGTPVGQILLRPKPKNPDVVDKYLQAANNCTDACPNKVGTTPFQAGTQVVCTMSENNTSAKQIVSLFTGNKLCCVAARLKGKGLKIVCPNHEGVCTAYIAEDASIGNEGAYSSWCATEVSDYLKISHITTDGDSRAFQGVKQVHGTNVEALRDVRHLSASMKRAITRCTFSPNLFSGTNKFNQKNRFALDIKARCVCRVKSKL